jgi:hypothetical protein
VKGTLTRLLASNRRSRGCTIRSQIGVATLNPCTENVERNREDEDGEADFSVLYGFLYLNEMEIHF